MIHETLSIIFFVKPSRVKKNGEAPIFSRITLNGERAEFSTKQAVPLSMWDKKKSQVKNSYKRAAIIKRALEQIYSHTIELKHGLEIEGKHVSASLLKDIITGKKELRPTILKLFKEHNDKARELIGIDFAKDTVVRYETSHKHTENFIKSYYGRNDLPLHEIDQKFVEEFMFYLKTKRKCSNNTSVKYLKNFKKIILAALKNGFIKEDPFANVRLKLDEVVKEELTDEELKSIINKKIDNERLTQVKDVFIFCCFTGLAFSDVKSLRQEHLKIVDNELWIKKDRQKTKKTSDIFLLDIPKSILNKYKNHVCHIKGLLLPVPSNQKMNAYLKEIADICGITKNISSHIARHTFASTVALGSSMNLKAVSKMLGHSSIKMTEKYARVHTQLIKEEMKKASDKYSIQKQDPMAV